MTARPCRSCGCYVKQGEQSSPCVRCPGKRATIDDMDVAYEMTRCRLCESWLLMLSDGRLPDICHECFYDENKRVACEHPKHHVVRGSCYVPFAHVVQAVYVVKTMKREGEIERRTVCERCLYDHDMETWESYSNGKKPEEYDGTMAPVVKTGNMMQVFIVSPIRFVHVNGVVGLQCEKITSYRVDAPTVETCTIVHGELNARVNSFHFGRWMCARVAGEKLLSVEFFNEDEWRFHGFNDQPLRNWYAHHRRNAT